MSEEKKNVKQAAFANLNIKKGMVCGPDGCSLADHYDWAKKSEESKKEA
ncbi:hypothetical protein [Lactobacillus sp. PV034]|nr:hypothetical protein [Lactobacillus sp. PV034]